MDLLVNRHYRLENWSKLVDLFVEITSCIDVIKTAPAPCQCDSIQRQQYICLVNKNTLGSFKEFLKFIVPFL